MKKIFIFALALSALASCSTQLQYGEEVVFSDVAVSINPSIESKVSGGYFEQNDTIGLFMIQGTSIIRNNVAYVSDASGNFSPVGDPIYYPMSGNAAFYAYYPYDAAGSTYATVDITNPKQQFIEALTEQTYNKETTRDDKVALSFTHNLAGLGLTVKNGGGLDSNVDVEVTAVTVTGVATSAVYSFVTMAYIKSDFEVTNKTVTGVCSDIPDSSATVYLLPNVLVSETDTTSYYSMDDAMLHITTTSGYYEVSLSSVNFQQNKMVNCTVNLSLSKIEDIEGSILGWDDSGDSTELELEY